MSPEPGTAEVTARLRTAFPLVSQHPDVAGLLRDPMLLAELGSALATPFRTCGVTAVLAPEARGPIVGAMVAIELGVGLVIARKQGENHPGADTSLLTGTTWRGAPRQFVVRSSDLAGSDRVLLVDDWVTTGQSLGALAEWVASQGAEVVGTAAIVDKATAEVRAHLGLRALVRFDEIEGVSNPTTPPPIRS